MSPALSAAQVARFEALLAARLGLQVDDSNRERCVEALLERVDHTRASIDGYLDRVGDQELRALAAAVTVGESYFFRGADHFAAFRDVVLPDLQARRAGARRLDILSAGCAGGEEPYTLATIVADALDPSWDVRILGVDVNPHALARARAARYSPWSLRETAAAARERWFLREGADHVLVDEIRRRVEFAEANLAADDESRFGPGRYDVVFCRNVLIYFTPDAALRLIDRLARALTPGGYLFLGHSETLRGISTAFHLLHDHDTFYYQVRGDPPPALPSEPAAAPAEPVDDGPWFEAIRRSSARIAELADRAAAPRPAARLQLQDAIELFRRERYEEARDRVRELSLHGDDADALLLLAAALANRGELDEAERTCRRLLAVDEMHAAGHYLLAVCREAAGDLAGAVSEARTAVYLDGSFAMPHLLLGRIARRSGEAAIARRELGLAIGLVPREDWFRLLLFDGGFGRAALLELCRAELAAVRS